MNMPPQKPAAVASDANGAHLPRMQIELGLQLADASDSPLTEKIAQAAEAAGADLLFVLPSPDGGGMSAMVRLKDAEADVDRYLQIRTTENGMAVAEEANADPRLLDLARSSVDVLRRIAADQQLREPLAAA